jgi:hypothetical protein
MVRLNFLVIAESLYDVYVQCYINSYVYLIVSTCKQTNIHSTFTGKYWTSYSYILCCSFSLKTLCRGSFQILLQNERFGLVRSKTSWKWAENDPCLWSAFISWPKRSFSEMSIFSMFSRRKRPLYKSGHWTHIRTHIVSLLHITYCIISLCTLHSLDLWGLWVCTIVICMWKQVQIVRYITFT